MADQRISFGLHPLLHGGFPDDDRSGALRRVVEIADEGGVDYLWVEDHTRLPPLEIHASEGDAGVDEPLEAWTTLAYLAGITRSLSLGTEVTPLTLRHPALLAKTVATLDQLCGGRVILGAGAGWFKDEFESLGIPFEKRDNRFRKVTEALEVIQALWREPSVDYDGEFYQLKDAVCAPKPLQGADLPIWFGGFSDRLFQLLLRFGTGWILGTHPAPEFVAERWQRLREMADEQAVDVSDMPVMVPLIAHVSRDRDRAAASLNGYVDRGNFDEWLGSFFGENTRKYAVWGTPEDAVRKLEPYIEVGVRHFVLDLRPPSIMEETAELLVSEVFPKLQEG